MPFCMNCGLKLPDGANFCYMCGTPTSNAAASRIMPKSTTPVEQEKMMECPKCGSSISRMDAICPYCGAQIINKVASSSVKEFADKLYEIERDRDNEQGTGLMKLFGMGALMEKGYGSKAFDRKISLISTFPMGIMRTWKKRLPCWKKSKKALLMPMRSRQIFPGQSCHILWMQRPG